MAIGCWFGMDMAIYRISHEVCTRLALCCGFLWFGGGWVYVYPLGWLHLPLQRRHNGHDDVSNHQPYERLLNRLFRRRSKKTSKLRVTGLCEGNSPVDGEFPAQRASNAAKNVSIWWRHHALGQSYDCLSASEENLMNMENQARKFCD